MLQPPQVFSVRSFEPLFPPTGTLGCMVCLTPQMFLPVDPNTNVDRPLRQLPPCLPWSSSHHLAVRPLHPGCPSPPLLPVWMNVSSLTPWWLNFHTVRFSGSSGYFLFLNLLSLFWLCKEANCTYVCLHLGRNSQSRFYF